MFMDTMYVKDIVKNYNNLQINSHSQWDKVQFDNLIEFMEIMQNHENDYVYFIPGHNFDFVVCNYPNTKPLRIKDGLLVFNNDRFPIVTWETSHMYHGDDFVEKIWVAFLK